MHDHQVARALIPAVRAAVAQAGDDPLQRAELAMTEGAIAYGLARLGEARTHMERSLALLVEAFGQDHPRVALAEKNLAGVLVQLGEQDAAVRRLERALAIMERAYGTDHPVVGHTHHNLAAAARKREDWGALERHARTAVGILERVMGAAHADTARARLLLAHGLREQRRFDEARAVLRAAEDALAAALPAGHPDLGRVRLARGRIDEDAGAPGEAEAIYRQVVAAQREHPPDHRLAYALGELARVVSRRAPGEALPIYDEALRIHTRRPAAERLGDVETLVEIAEVALAAGQPAFALGWFERMPEAAARLPALHERLREARRGP